MTEYAPQLGRCWIVLSWTVIVSGVDVFSMSMTAGTPVCPAETAVPLL